MSSAGILPASNGSAFELGNDDLEEGEILSVEIPVISTSSPKICATEELFPYMVRSPKLNRKDEKINYLLGHFQKFFGDIGAKEDSKIKFNQYGSFLVSCSRQSPSVSKSILRDKRIPVAATLNASRDRNSALTLNGLNARNGPKGFLRNKPAPEAPIVDACRQGNNMLTSNGLTGERNGPKDLLKNKTAPVPPAVTVSRERSNTCNTEELKWNNNGPKDLLKAKPVQVAQAVNVSSERNSEHISDVLGRKKNGPKDLLKGNPAPLASVVNVSRERNIICTDGLKEKSNWPKVLLKDKPVTVAPSVKVSRERNNASSTSDGLKQKKKNGPKGLVRDKSVPAAPTVNVSRERKSGLPSAGLREEKIEPKSLVRDKPVTVASTVNVSRKRISTFTFDGFLREKKNGSKGSQREKHVPTASTVNVCRQRNRACTSDGLSERNNIPNSLNIQIEIKPDSPKDVYQILKEFESPLEPMLSPLPESLLCLKESDFQPCKELESNAKDISMNQEEINPSPEKSKIVKMNKLKDLVEKVSEGKPYETLESLPCKGKSLSAGEAGKKSIDGIHNSSVQDDGIINDNWVCCDRCQKWRLLPLDANPSDLPEKWICPMLNWLPGMNKCSITEDETTRAVHALYKVDLKRDLKEESLTILKPLKRKHQLYLDNDDAGECSEGQVFKALKPCSVEDKNSVESKFQKSPSAASEQCNLSAFSSREQIPPQQMISDRNKRKMNFEEADQANSRNVKKAMVTKKGNQISFPLGSVPPSLWGNPSFKAVEAKSSDAAKNHSTGKNFKPAAASASDRYDILRRKILARKTQREKGLPLFNHRSKR